MFTKNNQQGLLLTAVVSLLSVVGLIQDNVLLVISSVLLSSPLLTQVPELAKHIYPFNYQNLFSEMLKLSIYVGVTVVTGLAYTFLHSNVLGLSTESKQLENMADASIVPTLVYTGALGLLLGYVHNSSNNENTKMLLMMAISIGVLLTPTASSVGVFLMKAEQKKTLKALVNYSMQTAGLISGYALYSVLRGQKLI